MNKYQPSKIESKWQEKWEKSKIYSPDLDRAKKPFYNLMMFPYPSAEGMHVGNMYAFTGADVYGRFKRMQGHDVFEPIGLDGFGIHSENYAIKVGRHPKEQAKISQKNFYRQLRATGNSYDWSRTVETYDPDYYKWTQWIFIQLFKKGLAYRKKSPVNFCPSCKTVLSDEQVITKVKTQNSNRKTTAQNSKLEEIGVGVCERCETPVEKRELEQWFFKITQYADRLLDGLTQIDWTEKVKVAQRQWIGKSEGVMLRFKVKDMNIHFEMFDSVPQTFMAQTFTVIAPEHPMVYQLVKGTKYEKPVMEFVEKIKKKKASKKFDIEKETEGIFAGRYLDYTAAKRPLPIWVASFVIYEYGTGVVNSSAHDERDFEFAKKYNIPLHPVMFPQDPAEAEKVRNLDYCYHHAEDGVLQEPQQFKGRRWGEVRNDIIDYIARNGWGRKSSQYHLRDWLISRQRYWGPPIPMVYCQTCAKNGISYSSRVILGRSKATTPESDSGQARMTNNMMGWFPVPEKDLPVLLPDVKDWKPAGTGKSPLASVASFVNTRCPNCGGKAVQETDVSDTFLDSAWYFLRYLATDYNNVPFPSGAFSNVIDISKRARWLPVNMYIGGAEHSVLHLLYVRFLTMIFHDLGLIDFNEPFPRFYAHGLLIKEGAKMSKSKGNVVVPDAYIKKYGADTLRTYLMFLGPFSQGGDFYDSSISGVYRFLGRVWRLFHDVIARSEATWQSEKDRHALASARARDDIGKKLHQTIKKVSEDMENLRFNTAIAALMELLNTFYLYQNQLNRTHLSQFILLLAPFAPHVTEELWEKVHGYEFMDHSRSKGKDSMNYEPQAKRTHNWSIHLQPWPKYDPKLLEEEEVTIVVQINGKVRDNFKFQISSAHLADQKKVEEEALKREKVKKHLEGKKILRVVYVAGKIINFVVD